MFDPKKVLSMGASGFPKPLTETERIELELERLRIAFYKFIHLPTPRTPPALRLLELYATLAGKTVVPSKNFEGVGIWFHVETPLTKGELLYPIETTFALHKVAIIPVDDNTIRLGHISRALRSTGKRIEPLSPNPSAHRREP
jgi:hypothetical protein